MIVRRGCGLAASIFGLAVIVAAQEIPGTLRTEGPEIDTGGFRYERELPAGAEGVVSLVLDAAVLAHSRGPHVGFADLRIVTDAGRQVPYLLEHRAEPLTIDLTVVPQTAPPAHLRGGAGGRLSIYRVPLQYQRLPSPRLVLETSARVFLRSVEAGAERPPDRQHRDTWFDSFGVRVWTHSDESTPAPPLVIELRADDAKDVVVRVDEGDNPALAITAAKLRLPSWRARFYRGAGRLRVLYGHDALSPPDYDLALVEDHLMRAPAVEITAGPERAITLASSPALSPALFWAGLAFAAVVLLFLIAKLIARA